MIALGRASGLLRSRALGTGLVWLCLAAAPAVARADDGTIRVLVETGGRALPAGAAVQLQQWRWCRPHVSVVCLDFLRTVELAASRATLEHVQPGDYTITVTVPGFHEAETTITLHSGEVVTLAATLRAEPPAAEPRAAAGLLGDWTPDKLQVVDRHQQGVPSGFDRQQLAALPQARNIWSLLEATEAAAILDRLDGAGLYLGEPGRFSMRGASWAQNAILLDGLDLSDPLRGGTPLATPDLEALETIDVTSALSPVEHAVPGVTLSLALREPEDAWRGTAQAYALSSGLQAEDRPGMAPSIARFGSLVDASALASGPLAGYKLRGLFSARLSRVRRFERSQAGELKARVGSLLAHLVLHPTQRDSLRLLASAELVRRPLAGRALFSGASPDERADSLATQIRWERVAEKSHWSVSAGLVRGSYEPLLEERAPDRAIERLRDGPVQELVFPAGATRRTWSLRSSLALRERRLGGFWHAPRFGVDLGRSTAREDPGAGLSIPEQVNGLAARVWDYAWTGGTSRRGVTDVAAYAADRIVWRDRLFVEAGLRLDRSSGKAEGAAQGISWTALSPRLSARLRLTAAGRLALFGGYGEYRHRLLLAPLAFGDPNAASASVFRWSDTDADGLLDASERGALVARVGPGAAGDALVSIDPGLKPPRTREFVIGLESNLGREWRFRFTGFDRRERDLLAAVDVGAPLSSYTVRYLPDPSGDLVGTQDDQRLPVYDRKPESFGRDRYLLTNPSDGTGLHQGAEARLEKAFGARLFFVAGATASRTEVKTAYRGFRVEENDQGIVGEIYQNPNADTYARGRTFFDRAFTIKVGSAYRAPGDLHFGMVARYQDGQPFARSVIVADLAQGPEAVPATPRGQVMAPGAKDAQGRYVVPSGHRFQFTLTVDARLEKGLRLGERRLALILEGFNLLGTRHEVEEHDAWDAVFREPSAYQPPRVIRLGARLDF